LREFKRLYRQSFGACGIKVYDITPTDLRK
jgi:hypothetical protein